VVVAPKSIDGALTIHQDASLYLTSLSPGEVVKHSLKPGRHAWVHVANGAVTLNGHSLATGDGAAVSEEPKLTLVAVKPSEVLLFDLA
jgi:redox-sensitive bicupin YhaK (pirin superfamily)